MFLLVGGGGSCASGAIGTKCLFSSSSSFSFPSSSSTSFFPSGTKSTTLCTRLNHEYFNACSSASPAWQPIRITTGFAPAKPFRKYNINLISRFNFVSSHQFMLLWCGTKSIILVHYHTLSIQFFFKLAQPKICGVSLIPNGSETLFPARNKKENKVMIHYRFLPQKK